MSEARDNAAKEPRRVPPLMTATWEAATTDSDPLAALGATRALVAHLSTWEAECVLIEAGRRRAERRRVVDKLAAAVILRSYLDRRREPEVE